MSDLVAITLQTAGRSKATQSSYQTAIGLFIRYLDQQRSDQLPAELQNWRPFAIATTEGKRTLWIFRPPSAILRLGGHAARLAPKPLGQVARTMGVGLVFGLVVGLIFGLVVGLVAESANILLRSVLVFGLLGELNAGGNGNNIQIIDSVRWP